MDFRFSFIFYKESLETRFYEENIESNSIISNVWNSFISDGKISRSMELEPNGLMLSTTTLLTKDGLNEWLSNDILIAERWSRRLYNITNSINVLKAELVDLNNNDAWPNPPLPYKIIGNLNSLSELPVSYTGNLGDSYNVPDSSNKIVVYRWDGVQWIVIPEKVIPDNVYSISLNGWQGIWQVL